MSLHAVPFPSPLEEVEQRMVAGWLDSRRYRGRRLLWSHMPLGRKRTKIAGAKLKREGVKRGLPDNWIFDPPPNESAAIGCVFELKRRGREYKKPTKEQRFWLAELATRGWVTFDARGFDDAMRQLIDLGY